MGDSATLKTVEIQRPDGQGVWRNLPVSSIVQEKDRIIIGGRFRILVDDEVIYPRKEADDYVMLEKEEDQHG